VIQPTLLAFHWERFRPIKKRRHSAMSANIDIPLIGIGAQRRRR
jgi:hypothetical protein